MMRPSSYHFVFISILCSSSLTGDVVCLLRSSCVSNAQPRLASSTSQQHVAAAAFILTSSTHHPSLFPRVGKVPHRLIRGGPKRTSHHTPPSSSVSSRMERRGGLHRIASVRFRSPLLDAGYPPYVKDEERNVNQLKPLLLYLPGFDGTILAPFLQFPELGTTFDVRAMSIDMSDRSTFESLSDDVVNYLVHNATTERKGGRRDAAKKAASSQAAVNGTKSTTTKASNNNPFAFVVRPGKFFKNVVGGGDGTTDGGSAKKERRPVYLMGESFGGILASDVALRLQKLDADAPVELRGVVLINPATCYLRSKLAAEAPRVASLSNPLLYSFALVARLVPLFLDSYQWPQLMLILGSKRLPSVIDTPAREAYMGRVAFSLPTTLKFMPRETLDWRLNEWLRRGCEAVTSDRLRQLGRSTRILLVAGELDRTLPSIAEAERLLSIMAKSEVHVVEGAGHASTCGSRVDLAAVMRHRFPELRRRRSRRRRRGDNGGDDETEGRGRQQPQPPQRTRMKEVASSGVGEYFGMEPRYDGDVAVGLSPLLYWSPKCYREWKGPAE